MRRGGPIQVLNWVGGAWECGVPLQYAPPFWAMVLVALFFLCEPYGRFKLRQPASSLWRFL